MSRKIRSLKSEDFHEWVELWRGYQAFYGANLQDDEDRLFSALVEPDEHGPFAIVCEDDGKLCGLAHFLFHTTTWSSRRRCYLNDLYTDPNSRGKGVGEALLREVHRIAEARGSEQTYWLTQEFNSTARKLYDRVGVATPFMKYRM